jgi:hypothetical protein
MHSAGRFLSRLLVVASLLTLPLVFAVPAGAQALFSNTINFDTFQGKPIVSGTVVDMMYWNSSFARFYGYQDMSDPDNPDPYTPAVAEDTFAYNGYTTASSPNALNAKQVAMWVAFDPTRFLNGVNQFGVTLDNDPFGDAIADMQLFDKNGTLLKTVTFDERIPGLRITLNLAGIQSVLLPGGAFYDNLSYSGQAVPEPGLLALFAAGSTSVVGLKLRRKRR